MTTKNYLQKKGMNQKHSKIIMIGIIILCFIIIFFIFKKDSNDITLDSDNTLSIGELELIDLGNKELLNEKQY